MEKRRNGYIFLVLWALIGVCYWFVLTTIEKMWLSMIIAIISVACGTIGVSIIAWEKSSNLMVSALKSLAVFIIVTIVSNIAGRNLYFYATFFSQALMLIEITAAMSTVSILLLFEFERRHDDHNDSD